MSGLFAALALASPARQLVASIALPTAILAAGFGLGVAWEHRGPQILPLSIAGDSLKVQRDIAKADVGFWTGRAVYWRQSYLDWKAAADRCDGARDQDQARARGAVTAGSEVRAKTASQSFNSGYAAGRVAGVLEGRKTCGAADAPASPLSDPADPIGDLVDVRLFDAGEARSRGVRDFNAGAYRPGREVPADGRRAEPR